MTTTTTRPTAAEFLKSYTWPRTPQGKIDKVQVYEDTKALFWLEADRVKAACAQAMEIEEARAKEQFAHLMLDVKFDGAAETFAFRMRQAILTLDKDPEEAYRQFKGCLEIARVLGRPCAEILGRSVFDASGVVPRDFRSRYAEGATWPDEIREAFAPVIASFESESDDWTSETDLFGGEAA